MKKVAEFVFCAVLAVTLVAHGGTTWYFNGGNDTQNGGISTPSKWVNSSGTAATAFSADDYYIVRNNTRLRIKGYTFTGGPMQIGDLSNNTRGGILHENSSTTLNFPNGLYLDYGHYWVYISISFEA